MFSNLSDLKFKLLQLAIISDRLLRTHRSQQNTYSGQNIYLGQNKHSGHYVGQLSETVTSTIEEVEREQRGKSVEIKDFLAKFLPFLHKKLVVFPEDCESTIRSFWLSIGTIVEEIIVSATKDSIGLPAPGSPKAMRPRSLPASPIRVVGHNSARVPLRVINGGNVPAPQIKRITLDSAQLTTLLAQVAAIVPEKRTSLTRDLLSYDGIEQKRLAEEEQYFKKIGRLYKLGKRLFWDVAPIFKMTFDETPVGHSFPVLDTSIWETLGSNYFLLENEKISPAIVQEAVINFQIWQPDQLNISPSCLIDIIARTRLLQAIKRAMSGFYGDLPAYKDVDCFRALQILSNLNLNPCLLMWEVIREILLRSRIHILQLRPVNATEPGVKYYYLTFASGSNRRIQLIFQVAVTCILFQGRVYEGNDAAIIFKMNVCIDLNNNTIFNLSYMVDYLGSDSELQAVIANIDQYDLCSTTVVEVIKAKVNSTPSYRAIDSLSDSMMIHLPVARLLPEYSRSLLDFALRFQGDATYQREFERVVTTDLPRTIAIPGLERDQVKTWQVVERFLVSQGASPLIIKAFKLQMVQGFLNPAFALWTNFFTRILPTIYQLKLFDAKGISGKQLKFTKSSRGEFLLELDYLIYGLEDVSNAYSTEHHQFPLFVYSVVLNLNSGPVESWIKSAVLIATPAGNQILRNMGKTHVISDAIANYVQYCSVDDRAHDQELLIQLNRHQLPDRRVVLIRGIGEVKLDRNAALRAILAEDFYTGPEGSQKNYVRDDCPRTVLLQLKKAFDDGNQTLDKELVDEIRNLLLHACYYDRYWRQSKDFKTFTKIQSANKDDELKSYIDNCLANEAISSDLPFEILAAFALLYKRRLHIFDEKLPDATHLVHWITHRSSFSKLPTMKLDDVFILRGLKTYYSLKVEILAPTSTSSAVYFTPHTQSESAC